MSFVHLTESKRVQKKQREGKSVRARNVEECLIFETSKSRRQLKMIADLIKYSLEKQNYGNRIAMEEDESWPKFGEEKEESINFYMSHLRDVKIKLEDR